MALRTTCMCNGEIIGIESIFTVINGLQINIPNKVEALRKKSRNNELFCPCGCGANLTLVAGDRNLREQHFRLKDSNREKNCGFISESDTSIYSKVVLKCWFDDLFPQDHIKTRVPICAIDDTNRKYEFTCLADKHRIAISYCHERANLSDDKLSILENNSLGIKVNYICDIENDGIIYQYPEMMIKIQKHQGYCLFLDLALSDGNNFNYAQTKLKVVSYLKDAYGCWSEIYIIEDFLSAFSFDAEGKLYRGNTAIDFLQKQREQLYCEKLEKEKAEKAKRQAAIEKEKLEQEKKRAEQQKRQEEERKRQEKIRLEQKRVATEAEKRRVEAEKARLKAIQECTYEKIVATIDSNQEVPFRDPSGKRWIRCEYCGKVSGEADFPSYGGINHVNLGTCKTCNKIADKKILPQYIRYSAPKEPIVVSSSKTPAYDPMVCPECGCQLIKRNGRNGPFIGCTGYPYCKYTRSIKNF